MDWSNEEYVRLYRRDTDDDMLLSWQARAVWHEMLKKFDRSGLVPTRRGARGLAALVRIPLDVVDAAVPELLEDGRIREVPGGYFAPNFLEAQEAKKGDALRQRESRERRRDKAKAGGSGHDVTPRDATVTPRDTASHEIEVGHTVSQPVTLPLLSDPDPILRESPRARAIPPSTEYESELVRWAWNYASREFGQLIAAGVPGASTGAWGGSPSRSYPPMGALFAIVAELLVAHSHDSELVRDKLKNRIDYAISEARTSNDAQYVVPARMWNASSFAIAVDLDPARAGPRAAKTETPIRIVKDL